VAIHRLSSLYCRRLGQSLGSVPLGTDVGGEPSPPAPRTARRLLAVYSSGAKTLTSERVGVECSLSRSLGPLPLEVACSQCVLGDDLLPRGWRSFLWVVGDEGETRPWLHGVVWSRTVLSLLV
jgi:hypothetical protein